MGWQDAPEAPTSGKPAWQSAPLAKRSDATSVAAKRAASYSAEDLIENKLTFGLADRVKALAPVVTGKANYSDALDAERQAREQYQATHSGTNAVGNVLSLLTGRPGAAIEGLAGAALKKAAVSGATINGAVTGGAQGFADANGSAAQQAGQTALGSGIGALGGNVLSRVLPGAINAVSRGVQNLAQRGATAVADALPAGQVANAVRSIASPNVRPVVQPSKAQSIIANAITADGNTPRTVGAQIAAARQRGVPLGIADTGDNVRGLAASTARAPGASRTIMRDAVVARQEGQAERVQGAIQRDLGPVTGVATEAQRLEQSAKSTAAPLYDQAYAAGAVDDPVINKLAEHPEMQSAIAAGKDIHANETFLANAKGETPPDALPADGLDVRTLDYTKRALDRKIDAAYSGDSASKLQLPLLKDLRSTLINRLDAAVPAYADARAAYAGPHALSDALQAGKSALNKTGDDIAAETASMGPSELEHYKLGLRSALSDKVESTVDGGDKVKALVGSPKKRAALGQLFGGTEGLDNFLGTLADESKAAATYARVNTGAPTAANVADDSNLDGLTENAKIALHVGTGNFGKAIGSLLVKAKDAAAGEAGKKVRAELAAALSETDPDVLAAALKAAQRAAAANRAAVRRSAPVARAATAAGVRASVNALNSVIPK